MIARGFLQIVPHRRPSGSVQSLRIVKLTQSIPAHPNSGALVVEVNLDMDEKIFSIPSLNVKLDASEEQVVPVLAPIDWHDEEEDED